MLPKEGTNLVVKLTNGNRESAKSKTAKDIFDQVGLTGSDESRALSIVLVVV